MTLLSKPQRRLRLAIVLQAIDDVEGRVSARDLRSIARIRADALAWIASKSKAHPLTFEAICEAFELNAERARTRLLRRVER